MTILLNNNARSPAGTPAMTLCRSAVDGSSAIPIAQARGPAMSACRPAQCVAPLRKHRLTSVTIPAATAGFQAGQQEHAAHPSKDRAIEAAAILNCGLLLLLWHEHCADGGVEDRLESRLSQRGALYVVDCADLTSYGLALLGVASRAVRGQGRAGSGEHLSARQRGQGGGAAHSCAPLLRGAAPARSPALCPGPISRQPRTEALVGCAPAARGAQGGARVGRKVARGLARASAELTAFALSEGSFRRSSFVPTRMRGVLGWGGGRGARAALSGARGARQRGAAAEARLRLQRAHASCLLCLRACCHQSAPFGPRPLGPVPPSMRLARATRSRTVRRPQRPDSPRTP